MRWTFHETKPGEEKKNYQNQKNYSDDDGTHREYFFLFIYKGKRVLNIAHCRFFECIMK